MFLLHEIPNPTPQVFELGRRLIAAGVLCSHSRIFWQGKSTVLYWTSDCGVGIGMHPKSLLGIRQQCQFSCSGMAERVMPRSNETSLTQKSRYDRNVLYRKFCAGVVCRGMDAGAGLVPAKSSLSGHPKDTNADCIYAQNTDQSQTNQNLEILGLRFSEDWMCPKERFEELQHHFGDRFNSIEIDSSPPILTASAVSHIPY